MTVSNNKIIHFRGYAKQFENRWKITTWLRSISGIERKTLNSFLRNGEEELDCLEKSGVKFYNNSIHRHKYFGDVMAKVNIVGTMVEWIRSKKNQSKKIIEDCNRIYQKVIAARYRMANNNEEKTYNPNTYEHLDKLFAEEMAIKDPDKRSKHTLNERGKVRNLEKKYKSEPLDLTPYIQANETKLIAWATEWKKNNPFWKNKELDSLQIKQLKEAATYLKWVPFLLEDVEYRHKFFKWALQDFNPVDVFITCPHTTKAIRKAIMHPVIGGIHTDVNGKAFLCFGWESFIEVIEKSKEAKIGQRRVLTIPVNLATPDDLKADYRMRRYDILNPDNIMHFCGGLTMKVKEFYADRAKVNDRVPKIAMGPYGAFNFDAAKASYWDEKLKAWIKTINIDSHPDGTAKDPKWYMKLIPTRIVSRAFLTEWYGTDKIDGETAFVKIGATREKDSNSSLGAHGLMQFYFPVDGKDYYHVVDIGKFGVEYANSWWKQLVLFCGSILAVIMCLDPNGFYSHRQWALLPVFPTEEEVNKLLENLRHNMLKEIYFQFVTENCASFVEEWVHEVFKDLPPLFAVNLFSGQGGIPLLDGYLSKFKSCRWIIQFLAVLPILILTWAWRWVTIKVMGKDGKMHWEHKSVLKRIYNTVKDKKDLCNPTVIFDKKDLHVSKKHNIAPLERYFGFTESHLSSKEKNKLDAAAAV